MMCQTGRVFVGGGEMVITVSSAHFGCGVNALSGLRGAFVGLIRRGKRHIRHWLGQTTTSLILRVQRLVHIHAGAEFKSVKMAGL